MSKAKTDRPQPGEIWESNASYGKQEIWYITGLKSSRPKYPLIGKRGPGAKTSYKLPLTLFEGGRKIGEFDIDDVANVIVKLTGKEVTFLRSVLTVYVNKDQSDKDKHRAHQILGKLAGV